MTEQEMKRREEQHKNTSFDGTSFFRRRQRHLEEVTEDMETKEREFQAMLAGMNASMEQLRNVLAQRVARTQR